MRRTQARTRTLALVAVCLAALAQPVFGQSAEERARAAEDAYLQATELLDANRYAEAHELYERAMRLGGDRRAPAMYWNAYTLYKLRQAERALAMAMQVQSEFSGSRWAREARALATEIRAEIDPGPPGAGEEWELRLIALHALVENDPELALPLLKRIIRGDAPEEVRENALFLLMQTDDPEAAKIVAELARDGGNPEMQELAVHHLAMLGDRESRALLSSMYDSTRNPELRAVILQSFAQAGESRRIVEAARNEKDAEVREQAIHLLGQLGEIGVLSELYDRESSRELREAMLHAFMMAGEHQRIVDAARGEQDQELREQAIHLLGALGEVSVLSELYRGEGSRELREAMLHAFVMAGEYDKVLESARSEPDRELRAEAVRVLGMADLESIKPFLREMYESEADREIRAAAAEALMMRGEVAMLVQFARVEKDPELRRQLVEFLAMSGSKDARDFLIELLEEQD